MQEASGLFVNPEHPVYRIQFEKGSYYLAYEIGAAVVDALLNHKLDLEKNRKLQSLLTQGVEIKVLNWQEIESERKAMANKLNQEITPTGVS